MAAAHAPTRVSQESWRDRTAKHGAGQRLEDDLYHRAYS
jgi:hypothetical protein